MEQVFAFATFIYERSSDMMEVLAVATPAGTAHLSLKELAANPSPNSNIYSQIIIQGDGDQMSGILHQWEAVSGVKFDMSENTMVRLLKRLDGWNERGAFCHDTLLKELSTYEE